MFVWHDVYLEGEKLLLMHTVCKFSLKLCSNFTMIEPLSLFQATSRGTVTTFPTWRLKVWEAVNKLMRSIPKPISHHQVLVHWYSTWLFQHVTSMHPASITRRNGEKEYFELATRFSMEHSLYFRKWDSWLKKFTRGSSSVSLVPSKLEEISFSSFINSSGSSLKLISVFSPTSQIGSSSPLSERNRKANDKTIGRLQGHKKATVESKTTENDSRWVPHWKLLKDSQGREVTPNTFKY